MNHLSMKQAANSLEKNTCIQIVSLDTLLLQKEFLRI